ncbi:Uncharacterised protein [Vibrio cholerae]|uniref:Uncharacterized protein n=1 Tax=Vibrio cholerae TaxID=666 RepID=A0A655WRL9_VIBCL|nr:Uncharacterised protein [Vibrio cholerae]CSB31539.1 Uncharacterised protein [Vibrio cholerae]CSB78834.1 Uncharacterised protein [Vibrio cholerae]CSB95175.1 Uncharacterised protein [Vibrio cholerae]CSC77242.1 Uncharacterised protein [Vibrio cholerae]
MEVFARQQTIHLLAVSHAADLKTLLGQVTLKQRTQARIIIYH